MARASDGGPVLAGIVAVAGAAAGGFGSFFRTSVQLANINDAPISGKLVFHPAGRAGVAGDPSYGYGIPAYGAVSINDVVTTMGQTGLGSIDVITDNGAPLPRITARVYNDLGAAGTSGFVEEVFAAKDALTASEEAYFSAPADLVNFRMNLGVRPLDAGVTIYFVAFDPLTGAFLGAVPKTYLANTIEQTSLASIFPSVPANATIAAEITAGSAIVYASTTDNRTNDSAIVFGRRPSTN